MISPPTNDNLKFYGNRLWVRIRGIWHMLMRSKQSWNAEMVWKKSCDSRKVSGLHDGNTSYRIPKDAGTCLCIICIQKIKRVQGR